jgi:hypothetical protein
MSIPIQDTNPDGGRSIEVCRDRPTKQIGYASLAGNSRATRTRDTSSRIDFQDT